MVVVLVCGWASCPPSPRRVVSSRPHRGLLAPLCPCPRAVMAHNHGIMDLNSPLFDRIRIKPKAAEDTTSTEAPSCEHPGCTGQGLHRAPKGRGQEGKYWRFCIDHVRAYNASYNYFKDMPEEAVAAYQKDSIIGHRPTWSNGRERHGPRARRQGRAQGYGHWRARRRHLTRRTGPITNPFEVLRDGRRGRHAPLRPSRPSAASPARCARPSTFSASEEGRPTRRRSRPPTRRW